MPYIERRGHSIRVKWWAGEYLPNGSKKYESASGPQPGVRFTDEDEAYDFGLDREYDVRNGVHVRRRDGNTQMKVYIWDWYADQELRFSSMRRYKSMLTARIEPYWGDHAVGAITAFEYQAWSRHLNSLVADELMSASYARDLKKLFTTIMSDAVEPYRLRKFSPVVVKARRGKYVKQTKPKKRPLEMETLYQLACNAYEVWGYTGWVYIWHCAFTGCRPGENWGLQRQFASPTWPASDPDAERRAESLERYCGKKPMHAIRVQYQHQVVEGKQELTGPKYDSHRTLVVPDFLHEMHAALLASHDYPWAFPSMLGRSLLSTKFELDYWYPIRDGADARTTHRGHPVRPAIPKVPEMAGKRIYALRHGHKEWLDEDGHCEIAVESRMGHEVAGVKGLYGNLTPAMELRMAGSLQRRWERFWRPRGGLWQPAFPTPLPVDHPGGVNEQLTRRPRRTHR
ncbi:integrase [Streptomyces violascens]|uniref:integrase n=1 Tax=Streptomyces violascens TaxID=67381 RepID=UPI0036814E1C